MRIVTNNDDLDWILANSECYFTFKTGQHSTCFKQKKTYLSTGTPNISIFLIYCRNRAGKTRSMSSIKRYKKIRRMCWIVCLRLWLSRTTEMLFQQMWYDLWWSSGRSSTATNAAISFTGTTSDTRLLGGTLCSKVLHWTVYSRRTMLPLLSRGTNIPILSTIQLMLICLCNVLISLFL